MTSLRAGRLEARLQADPPGLVVTDVVTGQVVLTPPAPTGAPRGLLGAWGFQTTATVGARRWRSGPAQWDTGPDNEQPPPDDGWIGATAVLDATAGADRLALRLGTAERDLLVEVCPEGDGIVAVTVGVDGPDSDVEAVGAAFAAAEGERWLGFGERSDAVVRAAGTVEHYVGEGPYQEWEYPFLGSTVPVWALRQRRDATYFPIPFALSTLGHAVAVDDDGLGYSRLRPDGRPVWSVEVEAAGLHYRIVAGPRPLDALGRWSATVGRQAEPERWWFGPWYQTGHANHVPLEEERAQLARLRAARAPLSAAETHCRYLPLGEHRGHEADEAARTAHFHAEGLAVLAYLNPLVGEEYAEVFAALARTGGLLRRPDGEPYTFEAYAGGRTPPVTSETQVDLTTPAGIAGWEAVAAQVVDAGHDGWMEDFGEYTPLDAHLGEGPGAPAGTAGHNRYATDYHQAAAEVTARLEARAGRRLARFVRSGWTGTASVAPIVWGGDPTTGWGFDGLASAVVEGLSAGASGVAMWGSDIGGFLSSVDQLTPELLCRWIQFGACCPVMRTKSAGIEPPEVIRPQIWDHGIVEVWVRWAAWHTQLSAYLAAAHARYRATGAPIMAALPLLDPLVDAGTAAEDQYFLGPDLVVAPVLAAGARRRSLHVPTGRWIDLWRVARYDPALRELDLVGFAAGQNWPGPGKATLPAPPEEIPVLLRAGAVLPLLSADVDTLSPYRAPGVVNAAERDDLRRLLCVPAGRWSGDLGPGEPATSTVDDTGGWALDLPAVPGRRYEVRADLGLVTGGRPVAVDVEGAEPGWTYDPATGVLAAEVTGRRLAVRPTPT